MSFPGKKLPPPGRWLLLFAAALLFILLLTALFLAVKSDNETLSGSVAAVEVLVQDTDAEHPLVSSKPFSLNTESTERKPFSFSVLSVSSVVYTVSRSLTSPGFLSFLTEVL
jgi:hypothetical protein